MCYYDHATQMALKLGRWRPHDSGPGQSGPAIREAEARRRPVRTGIGRVFLKAFRKFSPAKADLSGMWQPGSGQGSKPC